MGLLLVEDHRQLAASLSKGLREEGFTVDVESTGRGAVERLALRQTDAVILDLGLPDIDGLEVLSQTRREGIFVPVLVLTARDAVSSRVDALERGADDYLIKPFAFEELVARLHALLRRAVTPRWAPLTCGELTVDANEPVVFVAGDPVQLSPREHALLEFLMRRQGETLSRAEILAEVFGYHFDPGTNLVDVHIAHLRRKLGTATAVLETVRGKGYRLRAPSSSSDD